MRKQVFTVLLLLLVLAGCAPSPAPDPAPVPVPEVEEPAVPPPEPVEVREPEPDPRAETVEAILGAMTLEEKVGQMFFPRCPEVEAAEKIAGLHLGGCLLFTKDFKDSGKNWLTAEQLMEKLEGYQAASSVPLLIGVDEEGGTVARASRNPNLFPEKFQSPRRVFARGLEADPEGGFNAGMEAIRADAAEKSAGLRRYGINVNFAPVADVSAGPEDFMYDRTFGADAREAARFVAVSVLEMNRAGVGSVLKHFPGYGDNADTHTGIAVDERPWEQFMIHDFAPFREGILCGAGAVLVSHNIVTCMDGALPASLSPEVHRILREELGFEGVILTDDLAMSAVEDYAREGSVAELAVLAGNDMIVTSDFEKQIPLVLEAVEAGRIEESMLDEAVRRVLGWKYDLGLIGETND